MHLIAGDRFDAGQRLGQADLPAEVDLLPREVGHPAGGGLQAEHQVPLQVLPRHFDLVFRRAVVAQVAQLGDGQVDHFLAPVGMGAGVDVQESAVPEG